MKKNKEKFSPIITMIILILLVVIGTSILSMLNFESSKTMIVNGSLETTIVIVKNILSKDGLINFLNNIINNFSYLKPLTLMILSLIIMSVGKHSGLYKHLFSPLKKIKFPILVFLIIFIGVISTFILDYSYILLLPLVACLYEYLGKNPILGVLTIFLGITLGYGTGILYNYNDLLLGTYTQAAATVEVDPTYHFALSSNLYIMIFSAAIITFLLSLLINRYLNKKITINKPYEDELITSKKALYCSIIGVLPIIAIIIILIVSGVLIDSSQPLLVAKLFSDSSPFYQSFIFLVLIVVLVQSLIYGFISKNFKNLHDYSFALSKEFDNVGYLFILLFLYSILIGIIEWTNIGVVVTNSLVNLLSVLEFTGIPLIIISFVFIIIMSLLLPKSIEKWELISPIMIPLFMRANMSPNFTQFIFSAADSVGKVLTPTFIYFIIMMGLIQKYNFKENKIGLYGTIKVSLPILVTIIVVWLLLIIIWYISGIPLGINSYATM